MLCKDAEQDDCSSSLFMSKGASPGEAKPPWASARPLVYMTHCLDLEFLSCHSPCLDSNQLAGGVFFGVNAPAQGVW